MSVVTIKSLIFTIKIFHINHRCFSKFFYYVSLWILSDMFFCLRKFLVLSYEPLKFLLLKVLFCRYSCYFVFTDFYSHYKTLDVASFGEYYVSLFCYFTFHIILSILCFSSLDGLGHIQVIFKIFRSCLCSLPSFVSFFPPYLKGIQPLVILRRLTFPKNSRVVLRPFPRWDPYPL